MSFVGGKLKLKGGEVPLQAAGGVKKKKKKQGEASGSPQQALARVSSGAVDAAAEGSTDDAHKADIMRAIRGYELQQPAEGEDRRTEAEKRFQARQAQLEKDRLKKLAAKSHRDRVKEFNDHLANLSEHHDIPRVGPG